METRLFIALLNPGIALVLASAFLVLWLHQRHRLYLGVLVLAYSACAAGFLLQYFILPVGQDLTKLLSSLFFTLAANCLAGAVVARCDRRVPYAALAILGLCGMAAAFCWFMFVQPDLTWRIYAINFAFGGISLVVAAELRTVRRTGPTEAVLFGLSLLSALNFVVRTLIVLRMNGPFVSYERLHDSIYWTTALLSHALLSLLITLSLFTAAALDVLKALKAESHTDPLSGLLNRRGFEERAAAMLRSQDGDLQVALVIADLDHFKAVNDTFGHAIGDQVIAVFASNLRATAGKGGIVGRLGGEEFAVLLPVSDLAAARLFAEEVRTSFSQNGSNRLPAKARVTASFGVAAGEKELSALLRQADEALYHAKRNGRDSVRISYQRPQQEAVAPAGIRFA